MMAGRTSEPYILDGGCLCGSRPGVEAVRDRGTDKHSERQDTMKMPIAVHTDEDYERAQQRVAELNASPDSREKERELEALAEAMLAFELRRDEAQD